MSDCNVDDIMCQMEALKSMKSLKNVMGNETFVNKFPQLEGMEEKLEESILEATENLKTSLTSCTVEDLVTDTPNDVESLEPDDEDHGFEVE